MIELTPRYGRRRTSARKRTVMPECGMTGWSLLRADFSRAFHDRLFTGGQRGTK